MSAQLVAGSQHVREGLDGGLVRIQPVRENAGEIVVLAAHLGTAVAVHIEVFAGFHLVAQVVPEKQICKNRRPSKSFKLGIFRCA